MERILVSGPSITEKEISYVTDAVTNAWYGNANMYHERFEKAFASYLGVRYAIALPSCTSAIHLALAAWQIGSGDEVIVPDATWIASAAPISYVGATPVFADIEEQDWCLSPHALEAAITPKTKAVIIVDLYGNLPKLDALIEIARRHNLAILEDAAEALGSEHQGKKAGSFGDIGVFSFHGSKTLTTGEGGMLVTNDEALYRRILVLRDHGRRPGDKQFWNTEVAFKYKMSSMQAALGLAQLERIEELVSYKRQIFAWYQRELAGLEGVTMNYEAPNDKNSYWMVTTVLDPAYGLDKEQLLELLLEYNIDGRPFFYPLSSLPAYEHLGQFRQAKAHNKVSYKVCPFGVNLPCGMAMTEEKVVYVSNTLKKILQRNRA